mgnify:CR=1 FL=1
MKIQKDSTNFKIIKFIKIVIPVSITIFMLSCANSQEVSATPAPKKTINYLALGDSYTIGKGVEESLRWPNQLGHKLSELDYEVASVNIIAQTGWTTNNLLQAVENVETGKYNLVSLLIGVNNQFQKQPFTTFETEFNILIDQCITFAGDINKVFVVSIPDYGVTPFGSSNSETIKKEIDAYNAYIAKQCNKKNIPFINITEISRTLGNSDGALASDNLHPSGSQYEAWVNKVQPTVVELLEN